MQKIRIEKNGTKMHNNWDNMLRSGGINQSGKARIQNERVRRKKSRAKPIQYHKIHIEESRQKPIPIHKIVFKVV